MKTVRILWSGVTGKIGREAVATIRDMPDAKITLGLTHHDVDETLDTFPCDIKGMILESYDSDVITLAELAKQQAKVDVIVDCSHPDVFYKIVELAVRIKKPLIIETSGLSNRQITTLYGASKRIPVFRSENCYIKVDGFPNEVVELTQKKPERVDFCESFYEYNGMARGVLEIAKVMAGKKSLSSGFYDLGKIWDELPH